jgi:hypothetical protein
MAQSSVVRAILATTRDGLLVLDTGRTVLIPRNHQIDRLAAEQALAILAQPHPHLRKPMVEAGDGSERRKVSHGFS